MVTGQSDNACHLVIIYCFIAVSSKIDLAVLKVGLILVSRETFFAQSVPISKSKFLRVFHNIEMPAAGCFFPFLRFVINFISHVTQFRAYLNARLLDPILRG